MKHFKQFLLLLVLAVFSTSGAWATEYDLSTFTSDDKITLKDGDVIYGKLEHEAQFTIAKGATITLRNVDMNYWKMSTDRGHTALSCKGNCTIILEGTENYLRGKFDTSETTTQGGYGIYVTGKLTIKGDGKLETVGGINYSGIYAKKGLDILSGTIIADGTFHAGIACENSCILNIYGGKITAYGGNASAGIGGGCNDKCGTVNIYGGTVYAKGGSEAPGIGSGQGNFTSYIDGGTVNIYGGYVEAYGGNHGAGIGAGDGDGGAGGNITIYGGEVRAYGGTDAAGIGGGEGGAGGTITISGGKVYAEAKGTSNFAAGIGGGQEGAGGTITISGGEVTAYGGVDAAGIGGGEGGNSGTITISGGTVYAKSTGDESYGSGIGAGEDGDCSPVTISGGVIHAIGGELGHAIGTNKNTETAVYFADDLVAWKDGERSTAGNRSYFSCSNREVHINICDHNGATFTDNENGTHTVTGCGHCNVGTRTEYHVVGDDGKCTKCNGQAFEGSGTSDDPYLLTNASYPSFAQGIQGEVTFYEKHFKITEDITTDKMAEGAFCGTLDGAGHTVTLTLGSTDNYLDQSCALFNQLNGATIKNLRIAGNIYSSAQFNASMARLATGTNTIRGCVSTVSIHSNKYGDCTNGGFIGFINTDDSSIAFEGCAFTGEMIGANATNWGGFIGWRDYSDKNCTATFTDCLFAPTAVNVNTSFFGCDSRTFCRSNSTDGAGFTNCYYRTVLQEADGGSMAVPVTERPETIGSETTYYGLLKAYTWGLYYGGKFYYRASMPQGEGTADSPYLISNITEWGYIGVTCSGGNSYSGKFLKLTADLTTEFIVGGTFSGTLDGDGHTITLAMGSEDGYLNQSCALFDVIDGATIKNLRMAGSIYSSAQFNASIVCGAKGSNHIYNCISTVGIRSSISGDGSNGGFIGIIDFSKSGVNFEGCAFLGRMLGENTTNCGGFIGWRGSKCSATFTDCLFAPTQLNVDTSTGDSRTFCRSTSTDRATYTRCYYTTVLQEADGGVEVIASTTQPDDIGTAGTDYGFIQAYTNGMKCGDLYYVNSDHIKLADNADNYELINSCLGKTKNITLDGRTLYKDGKWNTICLPFDVTIAGSVLDGDGVQVRELNSAESNLKDGLLTLKFEEVSDGVLKAGTPYLIKWTEGDSLVSPVFKDVTITEEYPRATDFEGGCLEGNFSPYAIEDYNIGSVLMLTDDNKLAYSTAPRMLRNFRAHVTIIATTGSYAVKQATIDFGDGETTGIEIIDNGQLIIDNSSNEQWYDLSGRRLPGKPTQKGMYIFNGHKVVIK